VSAGSRFFATKTLPMPKASKSAKKAAPKKAAKKAVASRGAKKAAKKAQPEAAPQVDPAEQARADRQIKEGPYHAILKLRASGKSPAKAMAEAAGGR
jgi:hypothetical protein